MVTVSSALFSAAKLFSLVPGWSLEEIRRAGDGLETTSQNSQACRAHFASANTVPWHPRSFVLVPGSTTGKSIWPPAGQRRSPARCNLTATTEHLLSFSAQSEFLLFAKPFLHFEAALSLHSFLCRLVSIAASCDHSFRLALPVSHACLFPAQFGRPHRPYLARTRLGAAGL